MRICEFSVHSQRGVLQNDFDQFYLLLIYLSNSFIFFLFNVSCQLVVETPLLLMSPLLNNFNSLKDNQKFEYGGL